MLTVYQYLIQHIHKHNAIINRLIILCCGVCMCVATAHMK